MEIKLTNLAELFTQGTNVLKLDADEFIPTFSEEFDVAGRGDNPPKESTESAFLKKGNQEEQKTCKAIILEKIELRVDADLYLLDIPSPEEIELRFEATPEEIELRVDADLNLPEE
eukprot:GHVP01054679.1.p1 GENE.GHVP01054679.1~~GHVP01054679.1.p1  ORF type:complete len:116 (-),score=36.76 GHVP01054679.1:140-487(-)